jgi:hypothetical protein
MTAAVLPVTTPPGALVSGPSRRSGAGRGLADRGQHRSAPPPPRLPDPRPRQGLGRHPPRTLTADGPTTGSGQGGPSCSPGWTTRWTWSAAVGLTCCCQPRSRLLSCRTSSTVHAISGSFIRRSPAARRRCSHRAAGSPRDPPARQPSEPERGNNPQSQTVPQPRGGPTLAHPTSVRSHPGQGRSPSWVSSPTSHRRPTPSSARIRFTDHPCSTWRARR